VTNRRNGRSIVVTINDRGPFVRGRIIDLTPAAARALGFSGLAPVTVESSAVEPPKDHNAGTNFTSPRSASHSAPTAEARKNEVG